MLELLSALEIIKKYKDINLAYPLDIVLVVILLNNTKYIIQNI